MNLSFNHVSLCFQEEEVLERIDCVHAAATVSENENVFEAYLKPLLDARRQSDVTRAQSDAPEFDVDNVFLNMSDEMRAELNRRNTMYSDNEVLQRQKLLLGMTENSPVAGTFELASDLQSWNTRLEFSMGVGTLEERWNVFTEHSEKESVSSVVVVVTYCVKHFVFVQNGAVADENVGILEDVEWDDVSCGYGLMALNNFEDRHSVWCLFYCLGVDFPMEGGDMLVWGHWLTPRDITCYSILGLC